MINLRVPSTIGASMQIKDATSLSPFETGVEYASPARGTWTIAHTAMLVPQSHQIFVCARGCLRGVVLSAAEMNKMDRFSMITIEEKNVMQGDMEELIIEGTTNIINGLHYKPRAIMLFTSCVHHFVNADLPMVYRILSERFPDIDFVDCYMNPIMRKSKLTPDAKMRQQLYHALKPMIKNPKSINIIGNNEATSQKSELIIMLKNAGYTVRDICNCKDYEEYLQMAESVLNISFHPAVKACGDELERRLNQKHLYLPFSFDYNEIRSMLTELAQICDIAVPNFDECENKAEQALKDAAKIIGDMPLAIDFSATTRPLGLARLLLKHGFNVKTIYCDSFLIEEQNDFNWLKENAPSLVISAIVNYKMGVLPRNEAAKYNGKLLAIGQKAAYYTGTDYFVNIIENGGFYGFDAIVSLSKLMIEAAQIPKDTSKIIQVKAWGCCG
ncbi:MAG: nitrogenase component 1 [Oscillospiraceae bacterium]